MSKDKNGAGNGGRKDTASAKPPKFIKESAKPPKIVKPPKK